MVQQRAKDILLSSLSIQLFFYNIVKVRQSPSVFIERRVVLKSVRASYDLRQVNVRDLFTLKLSLVDCRVPSAIILVWRAMCNYETKFLS